MTLAFVMTLRFVMPLNFLLTLGFILRFLMTLMCPDDIEISGVFDLEVYDDLE